MTCRLLPTLFLHLKESYPDKSFVMAATDIADAFLTVDQREPTLVVCGDLLFDNETAVNNGMTGS